jgi:hypothetical protein
LLEAVLPQSNRAGYQGDRAVTKETIRRALLERQARLKMRPGSPARNAKLQSLLGRRIWPGIPKNVLGRRLSKEAEAKILGFGPSGA